MATYSLVECPSIVYNVTRAQHIPLTLFGLWMKCTCCQYFIIALRLQCARALTFRLIGDGFASVWLMQANTHIDSMRDGLLQLLFNWTCCYRSASLSPFFQLLSGIKLTLMHTDALNTNHIFNYWWIFFFFFSSVSVKSLFIAMKKMVSISRAVDMFWVREIRFKPSIS